MRVKKVNIADDVAGVLRNGMEYADNNASITRELDRGLYESVNKVLVALGGKWNRGAKAHVFPSDAKVLIETALGDGHVVDKAKTLEQFYTPPALAKKLVEMAEIVVNSGDLVLEPSAGRGAIVEAIQDADPSASICAVEIDPANVAHLRTIEGVVVHANDFLSMKDDASVTYMRNFDRVVMNPPFTDAIEHVRHAWGMLAPGGILVAVMPNSVEFREDKKFAEFRALVLSVGGSIEGLPEGTFKESGTGVNSVVVKMVKPAAVKRSGGAKKKILAKKGK